MHQAELLRLVMAHLHVFVEEGGGSIDEQGSLAKQVCALLSGLQYGVEVRYAVW